MLKDQVFLGVYIYMYIYTIYRQKYWHPLLMKGLSTLVISMSTNLNA